MYKFLSKHHLRHASEFDFVIKHGKRLVVAPFAAYFAKSDQPYPRLGMVISKKNCALAVDRNRIKRIIREQFRLNQQSISAMDWVVLLRSSTRMMSDQELCECIKKLFSQCVARCNKVVSP